MPAASIGIRLVALAQRAHRGHRFADGPKLPARKGTEHGGADENRFLGLAGGDDKPVASARIWRTSGLCAAPPLTTMVSIATPCSACAAMIWRTP